MNIDLKKRLLISCNGPRPKQGERLTPTGERVGWSRTEKLPRIPGKSGSLCQFSEWVIYWQDQVHP